jgi:diguanylate cyclase (GGDEF)-like protein
MLLNYTPYFFILFSTAVISALVGIATLRRHPKSPGRTQFILMMIAISGYAMVAAMEAAAVRFPEKLFWSVLEYVGSGGAIVFFLLFILHFTQKQHWLRPQLVILLWLLPLFNVILVATNAWHQLVWTGFEPGPPGSNLMIYRHGPGFFWIMACVYSYALIGISLLTKASFHPSITYRHQARLALLGAVFPLLGGIAYIFDLVPPGINLPPMCFMLTGLLYITNVSRFRLFDLVPVARDMLIETMSDSIMVLDQSHRIVDLNPAAKQLFKIDQKSIGKTVNDLFSQWQNLVELLQSKSGIQAAIPLDFETQMYFDIQILLLMDRCRQLTGKLVIFRDVTDQYQAEFELRIANTQLTKQLREIELLQVQLREQAARDRLTGLFNRHYWDETLPRELALAKRQRYSLAVILIDLDYFKRINDTFGHLSGDEVLKAFAKLLRDCSRLSDIVCRYGGEEFVLAMPGMSAETAFDKTEAIRLKFEATGVPIDHRRIYSTFSAGVSVFPNHGTSIEELMSVADQALYTAKSKGRNCTQLG